MNHRLVVIAAMAAALSPSGLAFATGSARPPVSSPSLFALPAAGLEVLATEGEIAIVPASGSPHGAVVSSGRPYEAIRYRPRKRQRDRGYRRESRSTGYSQLHAGFFDPDGDPSSGILFGFRAGAGIDDHLQLGLGLDWSHRSDHESSVVQDVPLPGGGTAERRTEISRSTTDHFPIMAFLQATPGVDLPITPYFGIGGGYQVLILSAEDFESGESFDATYGGWGWQAWGGAALPLTGRSRLSAEVFLNNAQVERDLDEAGGSIREVIDLDGFGMRFGLNWGF